MPNFGYVARVHARVRIGVAVSSALSRVVEKITVAKTIYPQGITLLRKTIKNRLENRDNVSFFIANLGSTTM